MDAHAPGDAREAILDAASSLFCSVGYPATTTRRIADKAGMGHRALVRHFARKEDILGELLDRTITPPLDFASWLDSVGADPDVALTTLVRAHVGNLCSLPTNLGTLMLLPESRAERFAAFWAKRDRLRQHYLDLVDRCVLHSLVVVNDVAVTTDLVLGLVESVVTWHPRRADLSPDDVGRAVAGLVLRALVVQREHIPRLMTQSQALLVPKRP